MGSIADFGRFERENIFFTVRETTKIPRLSIRSLVTIQTELSQLIMLISFWGRKSGYNIAYPSMDAAQHMQEYLDSLPCFHDEY